MLDLRSGAPTVGAPAEFDLASIGRRWAAMILDRIIMIVMIFIGAMLASLFETTGAAQADSGIMFVGVMVAVLGYVAYETLLTRGRGQTLGKRALKIRVVRRDGTPVGGGQALGRAITRTCAVSFFGLINYLPALFTSEKTCVHDLITGTRVVNAE